MQRPSIAFSTDSDSITQNNIVTHLTNPIVINQRTYSHQPSSFQANQQSFFFLPLRSATDTVPTTIEIGSTHDSNATTSH